MSKRHYREGTKKTFTSRTHMSVKEIRGLYISVGWIGQSREPEKLVRLAPYFDKGPGVR